MTQTKETTELLAELIKEIESWEDGYQIRARFADDGNGHRDFLGFAVRSAGIDALAAVLQRRRSDTERLD